MAHSTESEDAPQLPSPKSLLSRLPLPFPTPLVASFASSLLSYATSPSQPPTSEKAPPGLISMLRDTADAVRGSTGASPEPSPMPAQDVANPQNPGKRKLEEPEDHTEGAYERQYSRASYQAIRPPVRGLFPTTATSSASEIRIPPPSYEPTLDSILDPTSTHHPPTFRNSEIRAFKRPGSSRSTSTGSEDPEESSIIKERSTPKSGKIYSISQVLLKGREQGARTMLRRYLFPGAEAPSTEGEEPQEENTELIQRAGESLADTEEVDVTRNQAYNDFEEAECNNTPSCQCAYCMKARELRWQLFLLQEQQRLNHRSSRIDGTFSPPYRTPAESMLQLSQYPEYPSGPSQQQYHFPDQGSFYYAPQPPPPGQKVPPSSSTNKKPKREKTLYLLSSKITLACILLARFLYPHIKAFIQELLAYEREHKIVERLVKRTVGLMTWVYKSIFLALVSILLMLLSAFEEGEMPTPADPVIPEAPPTPEPQKPQEVDVLKGWFKVACTDIMGGLYEGVEAGVKACREQNASSC